LHFLKEYLPALQEVITALVSALVFYLLARFFPSSKGRYHPLPRKEYQILLKKYRKTDGLISFFVMLPSLVLLVFLSAALFFLLASILTFKTADTVCIIGLPWLAWSVPGTLFAFATIMKVLDFEVGIIMKKNLEEYRMYTISRYIYQYGFDFEKLEKYWINTFFLLTFISLILLSDWSITITKEKFKYHQFGFRHKEYTFNEINKLQIVDAYIGRNNFKEYGPYYKVTFSDGNYWNSRNDLTHGSLNNAMIFLSENSGIEIEKLHEVQEK
jgi:hypothetical protein